MEFGSEFLETVRTNILKQKGLIENAEQEARDSVAEIGAMCKALEGVELIIAYETEFSKDEATITLYLDLAHTHQICVNSYGVGEQRQFEIGLTRPGGRTTHEVQHDSDAARQALQLTIERELARIDHVSL